MRVAWITHQLPDGRTDHGPGLLKGLYAGGAEMSTTEMIAAAPDGVEVVTFRPEQGLPDHRYVDKVVVGATERLTPAQIADLVPLKPVVWLRSVQPRHVEPLLRAASVLIWPSHGCAAWHPWSPYDYEICPAPLDTSLIPRGTPKQNFALWAARNHPQKGRTNARLWAWEHNIELVEVTDAPREEVLELMGRARWFVHLPKGVFDPCPRSVIEAEIAGCEIVANSLVGRVPASGPEAVAKFVEGSAERFWRLVTDD